MDALVEKSSEGKALRGQARSLKFERLRVTGSLDSSTAGRHVFCTISAGLGSLIPSLSRRLHRRCWLVDD